VLSAVKISNLLAGEEVPIPTLVPSSKICEFPIALEEVNFGM